MYFANRCCRHEFDLTELDDDSTESEAHLHVASIMKAASEDLRQDCKCESFVFVTCKGSEGRQLDDRTTRTCVNALGSHSLTRVHKDHKDHRDHKEDQHCSGTFRLWFQQDRNCVLLRVHPTRQERKRSGARGNSKVGGGGVAATAQDCWVAVDSAQRVHKKFITSNGQSPQDRVRRAALKVPLVPFLFASCHVSFMLQFSKLPEFKSQATITVELDTSRSDSFSETFNVADLRDSGERRRSSKGSASGASASRWKPVGPSCGQDGDDDDGEDEDRDDDDDDDE